MEHKFVEMAKARLQDEHIAPSLHKQIHTKTALINRSGMICSGEQTILLYNISLKDLEPLRAIIHCLERLEKGMFSLSPSGLACPVLPLDHNEEGLQFNTDDDWLYVETIGLKNRLSIIGGGHCALALSRIMQGMDFYITVFDDRPLLDTMSRNQYVHQKHLLPDYGVLGEHLEPGENNYVVIMTVGYRTDALALRALMNISFRYLGVLGSKSKIEKLFSDLLAQGYQEEKLARLHAPVGLPIHSHTPEEVAISIAAEIIRCKNEE